MNIRAAFCLLLVAALTLNGCCTTPLLASAQSADPPLTTIHAAYSNGDEVILDYSVGERGTDHYGVGPARYWAIVNLGDVASQTDKFVIHRSLLPSAKMVGWKNVNVIDLREKIVPAADGYYKLDSFLAFTNTIPKDDLPAITMLPQGNEVNNSFFSIVFLDQKTGKRTLRPHTPGTTYIPLKNIPLLIILFPFALIGDILTAPFLLFMPRIDG